MTQHKQETLQVQHKQHKFYDTAIGKITIGVSIFLCSQVLFAIGVFIMTSGVPPACKAEFENIKAQIVIVLKAQEDNAKEQKDFIQEMKEQKIKDEARKNQDHKVLMWIAKGLKIETFDE